MSEMRMPGGPVHPATIVPNRPGVSVVVNCIRTAYHPARGEMKITGRFVGASAVSVSAEKAGRSDEPITWRFMQGFGSQDDAGTAGSEWREWIVRVPRTIADAKETLENDGEWGAAEEFEWFVFESKKV